MCIRFQELFYKDRTFLLCVQSKIRWRCGGFVLIFNQKSPPQDLLFCSFLGDYLSRGEHVEGVKYCSICWACKPVFLQSLRNIVSARWHCNFSELFRDSFVVNSQDLFFDFESRWGSGADRVGTSWRLPNRYSSSWYSSRWRGASERCFCCSREQRDWTWAKETANMIAGRGLHWESADNALNNGWLFSFGFWLFISSVCLGESGGRYDVCWARAYNSLLEEKQGEALAHPCLDSWVLSFVDCRLSNPGRRNSSTRASVNCCAILTSTSPRPIKMLLEPKEFSPAISCRIVVAHRRRNTRGWPKRRRVFASAFGLWGHLFWFHFVLSCCAERDPTLLCWLFAGLILSARRRSCRSRTDIERDTPHKKVMAELVQLWSILVCQAVAAKHHEEQQDGQGVDCQFFSSNKPGRRHSGSGRHSDVGLWDLRQTCLYFWALHPWV